MGSSYDVSSFYRNYDLQFRITELDLEKQQKERINNYKKFWRAYRNKADAPDRDTGRITQIEINYNRIFADALTHFMVGKGIRPHIPYNQTLQDFINKVWNLNNRDMRAKEIVLNGKVAGDVFIKVIPYVDTVGRESMLEMSKFKTDTDKSDVVDEAVSGIEELHTRLDEATDKVINEGMYILNDEFNPSDLKMEILVLDEKRVFPTYAYTPRKELVKCVIFMDGVDSDGESFTLKETWTKTTITVFKNDEIVMGYPVPNYLGYIPITHIANIKVKNSDFGESDIEKSYNLNFVFNDIVRDIRGIVRYFSSPMTVLIGASLKSMVVGPDKTYAIPKGADLKHITLDTDLPAANKFLEIIKQSLHEATGVHARSLGGSENAISNTSGVALHTEYYSLIRATDLCKDNYIEGFKKINRAIICYGFLYNGLAIYIDNLIADLLSDLGYANPQEVVSKLQNDPDFTVTHPMDKVNKLLSALMLKLDLLKTKDDTGNLNYFNFMKTGVFGKWIDRMDIGLSYSLPKDEMLLIQNIRDRKDLHLMHRKDALKKLDEEDINAYMQEVERDELELAKHSGKVSMLETGPGGFEELPPEEGGTERRDSSEQMLAEDEEAKQVKKKVTTDEIEKAETE